MPTDVKNELKRILEDIHVKTGVNVSLENGEGKKSCPIEYCGKKFDVYFSDETEEKKCAGLVAYLLSNVDLKQILPNRDEYLKSILLGEGNRAYAYRFLTKFCLADDMCYVLDVMPERRIDEAKIHIENCFSDNAILLVQMDATHLALIVFMRSVSAAPVELGRFVSQSLYEELGIRSRIGIGCEVKSFTEVSLSYAQAVTALRMSGMLDSKGDVHTYREYLLVKMLEDVPEGRLREYMEQFHVGNASELFADSDMINTAEEFLENSLNVSETSRNLFVHRNTLMYRLDKIERITGLNIRNFSDAVTFRVITILYKLMQS